MLIENPTEDQTRRQLIDKWLKNAGWDVNDRSSVQTEFEIKGTAASKYKIARGSQSEEKSGFSDYLLLDRHGEPLAIVEAKRTSRDPIEGKQQAEDYAEGIKRETGRDPFVFMTNGYEIWYWNVKKYAPVMVHGFFTRDDLERIRFQNDNRKNLHAIPINPSIADRDYQLEALKRVYDGLDKNRKKFLLVMATGTGKTRTAMALIDVMMKAGWAQKVLFLVDREALAMQAFTDGFKQHLPNESRCYIRSGNIDSSSRIFVSTIQTMMECFDQISPGYFDVIIADECHRSIYNKWKDVLSYFHAVQIGLTATPADFIERDTFKYFGCDGSLPTFNYTYENAVKEGYLVDFRPPYAAQTNFQIKGIKGSELPPSIQKKLAEEGMNIEEIDFEGTDLEKKVTNLGTNESLAKEFMEVCVKDDSGVLPGKSIIFAVSHNHAKRLWEVFNSSYPEYKGQLVEIIDSRMERPLKLLDKFKNENFPRVAISVDMLDTGIDVREITNLVFAKPVFSKIKFWQMIGRGTRTLEKDPARRKPWCTHKEKFLIIDHWNNFEYFGEKPEGDLPPVQDAVTVKLFKVRLAKLRYFKANNDAERFAGVKAEIMADLQNLPGNSITIRENRRDIDRALSDQVWSDLDQQSFEFLETKMAPLMRFRSDINYYVEQFVYNAEKLGLLLLNNEREGIARLKDALISDLKKLPRNLSAVKEKEPQIIRVLSDDFWHTLDYEKTEFIKNELADLMRYKLVKERPIVELDLDDLVADRKWIEFGPGGEGDYAINYREKVEKKILDLSDSHPALKKIKNDQMISEKDLADLADTLNGPELYINENNLRKAFFQPMGTLIQFIKSILGKYEFPDAEQLVNESFNTYVIEHNNINPLNAEQIRFLRVVKNVFAKKKHLDYNDLFEPPFTQFGDDAATRLFKEDELKEIVGLFNAIKA
jgi:type I restriction enzyme, R subunit